MDERKTPISQNNAQHFEFANSSDLPAAFDGGTAAAELDALTGRSTRDDSRRNNNGATVFQTSLNVAKLCMGTGTLALPFAAQKGGLVFNMIGLGVIVVWNYYSADCLLGCLDFIQPEDVMASNDEFSNTKMRLSMQSREYGAIEGSHENDDEYRSKTVINGPPEGTTTYGVVAWHSFGNTGLIVLDLLMIMLFIGLLISYEAAMISFMDGINISTGYSRWDKLLPAIVVAVLSCAKDISFLSKFSATGLIALALSFGVISGEGIKENGWVDFKELSTLNLWPESLSAASSWFGVVVFGYGVVPVIFNVRESMAEPQFISISTSIGLGIAYVGYLFASNGIRILFSKFSFDGDVLQVLPPNSAIALSVRLMMTFVVAVTAPFIVVPCGEMIEGKLNMNSDFLSNRIAVRTPLCAICTLLAVFVPGFVFIISFVGCFCVSMTGFVLPPLFSIRLKQRALKHTSCRDVGLLLLGVVTTVITSAMTFRSLVDYSTVKATEDDQTITAGYHNL